MNGIFTYIWVIYGVNVGKYTIHGSSGIGLFPVSMFPMTQAMQPSAPQYEVQWQSRSPRRYPPQMTDVDRSLPHGAQIPNPAVAITSSTPSVIY